jgi:hypothetical protein
MVEAEPTPFARPVGREQFRLARHLDHLEAQFLGRAVRTLARIALERDDRIVDEGGDLVTQGDQIIGERKIDHGRSSLRWLCARRAARRVRS